MPLEYLMFWLRETFSNVVRNRLMSVLAISTVTIGLFILGAFYMTVVNIQAVVANQSDKLELDVYLNRDISAARRKEIFDAARIPQVRRVVIVTRDQALSDMKRDYPNIPASDFEGENNPLSDELHIQVKSLEDIHKVRDYMGSLKGVQHAEAPSDIVQNVLVLNRIISVAGFASLVVLGLAILLIIHNAIRLTIFARRREIGIMEMVGATSTFISLPFLMEGVIYGFVGAIIAAVLLNVLYATVSRINIPLLRAMLPAAQSGALFTCAGWMIVAGLAFGLLGSWISLSRSLDQAAHL